MQWILWFLAIALSFGAGYWVFRADKKRTVPVPLITSLLRGLVIFLTLILLLIPNILITKNLIEKPIVIFLQDNSSSIGVALSNDTMAYHKNATKLIAQLSEKYKVIQLAFGSNIQKDSLFVYQQTTTDIAGALAYTQEYYGMQNLGAIILASDGRFNQGANPLYQQLALHCPVYTVGIGDSAAQKDIKISNIHANKIVTLNSSFEIRADIVAQLCKGYNNNISLKENGIIITTIPVAINYEKYDHSFSLSLKAEKTGLHHYVLFIPQAAGEKNLANNKKDIFIDVVDEKKKILIIAAAPHPDINAIKNSLSGIETYSVTVTNAEHIPKNLNEYSALILHGLPNPKTNITSQIIASQKPFWLILTNQTGFQNINELQNITHTNITQGPIHSITASYQPAFNTFILPGQIAAVTDKMPPLTANVANVLPAPGAAILFEQKTLGNSIPIWTLQQGSVPSALLCGEGIWRWRVYEYKNFTDHNVVDECIRQTMAFLCANTKDKPFSISFGKSIWSDQEPISLNGYVLNANHEQINTPDVQIIIVDSNGNKTEYTLEKSGSAYTLNIGVHAAGNYSYTAKTNYNGVNYNTSGTFIVEKVALENMETGADYPLLYALSQQYHGSFVPSKNMNVLYDSITHNAQVKPVIQTSAETVPLIDKKWYFFVILLIATAEWLLRKYWLAQ